MILWIIPARSGSKGVPHKNKTMISNVPLFIWRFYCAEGVHAPGHCCLSTESEDYAKLAQEYGLKVEFLRPSNLATDTSSSSDVVLHALSFYESKGMYFDYIGLLEPTSPFVSSKVLEDAYKRLLEHPNASGIVATRQVHPSRFYIQSNGEYLDEIASRLANVGVLRRQEEDIEITPSGGFYISKVSEFKRYKSFYTEKTLSYLVDGPGELEIDSVEDIDYAKFLVDSKRVSLHSLFGRE